MDEARAKLCLLTAEGPSAEAFTFADLSAEPREPKAPARGRVPERQVSAHFASARDMGRATLLNSQRRAPQFRRVDTSGAEEPAR